MTCCCCDQPAQLNLNLSLGTNAVASLPLCHHHACEMQLGYWRLTLYADRRHVVDIEGWNQD